ncbi:acyl-CoA dehydrogenase family protein [Nocardioides jensenii]|uniref:acyl-CoA dehydrogenase family protein n=1 Tax=Nocardioides jensenii TaxID=1843 RepID=UPI00082FA75D|nr:acyl-CoA dehydrogenase family protein [Nocardioides jensenii]
MNQEVDLLQKVRDLEPIVERETLRCQEAHQMTPEMADALQGAGLFWMNVPQELGGFDVHPRTRVEVIEELSRQDGSIGWTYMAIAGYMGYVSCGVEDEAAKNIFSDPEVKIAGMANPVGTIIDKEDGTFQVHGNYKFGSGVPQADWIAVGGFVQGGPNDGESLCAVVPVANADLKGNWNPIGLIGTGSVDYDIPEQSVPTSYSFNVGNYQARRGGPAGRMDFFSTAMIYHSAVCLGVTKRALEEIVKVVDEGKKRPNAPHLREQQLFLHDFAQHEGKFQAIRSRLMEQMEEAYAAAQNGDALTEVQAGRFRQTASIIHRIGMDAIEFAYFWGGSASLRQPTVLGRCMLDMHALNNHILVDATNFTDPALILMGEYRR